MPHPGTEDATARSKRRREVLAAALGSIAVVLIWRALWDIAVATMSRLTSLIVGLILISLVALLNQDYLKKLF
jgi:hypothetical protein